MRADDIEIPDPCTIDLRERIAGAGAATEFHCDQCDRMVHVLSHSSEAEAAAILARRQRDGLCVAFLRTPDGRVLFRGASKSLVPASRLAGPRMLLRASALALGVAACSSDSPAESVELVLEIDAGAPPALHDEVEPELATKPEGTRAEIEQDDMIAVGGEPPGWDQPRDLRASDRVDDEADEPDEAAELHVTFESLKLTSKQEPPRDALSRTKVGRRGGLHVVELSYCVDKQGRVVDAKHARGDRELARVFIEYTSRWQFRPYEVAGRPTRVCTTQRFIVDLDRDKPV